MNVLRIVRVTVVIPLIHTITFKCVGTMKERRYQEILKQVSQLPMEDVRVKLQPEPDNPYDSKAIAFVVNLNGKEHRIGYVVHELLDEVHHDLSGNLIKRVQCAWVKFIVEWPKSDPGYYCGCTHYKERDMES